MDEICFGSWEARYSSFGVAVRVQANRSDLRRRVGAVIPPHSTSGGDETAAARLTVGLRGLGDCRCGQSHDAAAVILDGEERPSVDTDDALVERARAHVKLAVAERAPLVTFVHAGAVVVGSHAIVMPGRSFSGKTTLVRALIERGAAYLSDDYAVIDGAGRVEPFAQPLGVRAHGSMGQIAVDPAVIGAVAAAPFPLGLVVVTRHVPGTTFAPEQITRATAVGDLMSHAVAGRTAPARVLHQLTHAVTTASCRRGLRGDADQAADVIMSIAMRLPDVR